MLELLIRFYLGISIALGIYAFCLCGVPEIQGRRVLDDRSAPVGLHILFAVVVAALVGVAWPWHLWQTFGRR